MIVLRKKYAKIHINGAIVQEANSDIIVINAYLKLYYMTMFSFSYKTDPLQYKRAGLDLCALYARACLYILDPRFTRGGP